MPSICQVGQYYESALGRCRSCKIPCSIGKEICKAMGCEYAEGYKGKLPTEVSQESYQPTGNLPATTPLQAVVRNRSDEYLDQHTLAVMWAPITAAVLVLIALVIGLVLIQKGRPFPVKKEIGKGGQGSNDHLIVKVSE